jgi:hypothetical protein
MRLYRPYARSEWVVSVPDKSQIAIAGDAAKQVAQVSAVDIVWSSPKRAVGRKRP